MSRIDQPGRTGPMILACAILISLVGHASLAQTLTGASNAAKDTTGWICQLAGPT
jgi:hypothetical protein